MADGRSRGVRHSGRSGSRRRWVVFLLAAALVLRLGFVASRDPHDWLAGGDGPWYVLQGWFIANDALPRTLSTVGPLYPLALATVWRGFTGHAEPREPRDIPPPYLWTVRVLQALVAVLTVALAFALTRQMVSDPRAALLTVAGIGLGPAFVIEPFMVRTETVFMALFTAALVAYVAAQRTPSAAWTAVPGVLLGLATLTRPILSLFPVVLAAHLVLRHGAKQGIRRVGALALAYMLTVLPWHVTLYRGTGSWLPDGFAANLLSGASGEGRPIERATWADMERAAPGRQVEGAVRRIAADPVHWIGLRSRRILDAIAQPHGTVDFGDASVKQAAARWLREDRSLTGGWAIVARPAFTAKATMYAFHYAGLLLAALGAWVSWRRWREWLPIYLAIGYLIVAYGVLTILPRYFFPATVFLWVLAGLGLTRVRPGPRPGGDATRSRRLG